MIQIKKLFKSYSNRKNEFKILKNINLKFENNGFVSILGPSGCGKTTLLNLIGGLDFPTSGNILIDNKDITELSSKKIDAYRNNCVGFIFQNSFLIENLTVYENIKLSLDLSKNKTKNKRELVKQSLLSVGLNESFLNKKSTQLSGGEQQRVAIARAIINKPQIILADEPTGALDSKTSKDIIKILKELSKKCLVIMVTHNEELAVQHCDRIIRLFDGKIQSDEILNNNNDIMDEANLRSVKMNFLTSFLISIKNIISNLLKSLLTSFAGCIGIVAIILVLSVSKGTTLYINDVQSKALESYPVIVRSSAVISSTGNIYSNRVEYPDDKKILVSNILTNYEHVNNIDEKFIDYISKLDKSKYTILNYSQSVNFRLYYNYDGEVERLSNSYLQEMLDNEEFILSQYDVLAGKLPSQYNELALVVDSYNTVSAQILDSLGLECDKDEYSFDEILDKEYKIIDNNIYYTYDELRDRYVTKKSYEQQYDLSNDVVRITAIIRENKNCSFPLYSTGLVYTTKLTEYVHQKALASDVVVDQLNRGTTYNVTTGKEFTINTSLSQTRTIDYQYESLLISLGAVKQITRINIYSLSFEDRNYIENYVKGYSEYSKLNNITYYDYMSSLSKEFQTFIELLTKTLVIFGSISLIVSAIMIFITTYISVIERRKEIGLLRCIGARKLDIVKVFSSENIILGVISCIFAVIFTHLLKMPINNMVRGIMSNNLGYNPSNSVDFVVFDKKIVVIILLSGIIINVISGLIPSVKASFEKPSKVLKGD